MLNTMSILESLAPKIPNKLKPPLRVAFQAYWWIYKRIALIFPLKPFKVAKFTKYVPLKLNVGCGQVKYPGWVNIDIEPGADLVLDVRKGLPFDDNSVDFIYNEHLLEHLTFEEGEKGLSEFHRCLKKEGVLRIAMPDLDWTIQQYDKDFRNEDWFPGPGYEFVKTKGMAINMAFYWWGHKYLYNEEDLRNQLAKVGFKKITGCEWNKSNCPELSGLETRKESRLIVEAKKE